MDKSSHKILSISENFKKPTQSIHSPIGLKFAQSGHSAPAQTACFDKNIFTDSLLDS
jgi:hypothetical protein